MKNNFLVTAIVIALGLATCGYFVSQTLYNAKVALNTATVKGLAERRVKADHAQWTIDYRVEGRSQKLLPTLYKTAANHSDLIVARLKEAGFTDTEIDVGILDYRQQEYRNNQRIIIDEKHSLHGKVTVSTKQVEKLKPARKTVNQLVAQGVLLNNNNPTYRYTKLNEIKPAMLKTATQNARIAATEFAENAGVSVGGIREARQGGFIIRDAGENYGDTNKIEKDVRVVTTITFYLTD